MGSLGYMVDGHVGDDEHPASVGDIDVGGPVIDLAAGTQHTCAVLPGGALRCWGYGNGGALGYGNTEEIGDDETPAQAGDVDVGGPVITVGAGHWRTCVIIEGGRVRCWGMGGNSADPVWPDLPSEGSALGYGNLDNIGDDETPASVGDIDIGGIAVGLAVGGAHTCVLLDTGAVRCWGNADDVGAQFGGRLGYGNSEDIGDDETPASAGDVDVGGQVVSLTAGGRHTCALLVGGAVRCWGAARVVGYGNANENIGDDETPASAGDLSLGGLAIAVEAGWTHTCAIMQDGGVRCWGYAEQGQLGYGNENPVGWTDTPADAGDIDLGGVPVEISLGQTHTCALLDNGGIRCWGGAQFGQLGYANTVRIGDDETPASVGFVQVE